MFHLPDRQLALLGMPTRAETVQLVGWMALANMLGPVCDGPVGADEMPSRQAARWIGGIGTVAALRKPNADIRRKYRQDVPHDGKRKVRARTA